MELIIRKVEGVYDEMTLSFEQSELYRAFLSMPYASTLNGQYGIVRHPVSNVPPALRGNPCTFDPMREGGDGGWDAWANALQPYKPEPAEHLRRLNLLDDAGRPSRRVIMVGNRNLGNNWGFVAYHRDWETRQFALKDEPLTARKYRCLVYREGGTLSVEQLAFLPDGNVESATAHTPGNDIIWATFGNQVLDAGRVRPIREMLSEFYDLRHVVCLSHARDAAAMQEIWSDYPGQYADRLEAAIQRGVPRSRYLHNCVALTKDRVAIIQRFGTPEELAEAARSSGFESAVLLDNGGSVFTYAWFVRATNDNAGPPSGGCVYAAPDWRPGSISTICFVLHGPAWLNEPPGSTAFHIA